MLAKPPICFICWSWLKKSFRSKPFAAFDFFGHFLRRSHVHARGDLLDQRQNVAHAQHAAGVAFGVKDFQTVEFFRRTGKLDGRAGDVPHRQRRAAARVAVQLGQDDAGQRQGVFEGLGGVDGVLTLHGVDHKQGFNRVQHRVEFADLVHQHLVDTQTAGGIDQAARRNGVFWRNRARQRQCRAVFGRRCWGTTRPRLAR